MGRIAWLIPFLVAGCSTAPIAGLMDSIDKFHRRKSDRDPPPIDREAPPPIPVTPPPAPVGFDPVRKLKPKEPEPELPPEPPRSDPPAAPASFDPKRKVKPKDPRPEPTAPSSTRSGDRDPPRLPDVLPPTGDRKPGAVLPPPPPPSDERNDF